MRQLIQIKKIIVHCSASKYVSDYESIRQVHLLRKFEDIGYHYVITPKGEIQKGRSLGYEGAHVRSHNNDSIGICMGGVDDFPIYQFEEMRDLVVGLCHTYDLGWLDVYCHNEFNKHKTCPNFSGDILRAYIKGGFDGNGSMVS